MTGRHLVSTEVSATICQKCRQGVITAWDEGLHVVADAYPLTDADGYTLLADSTDLAAEVTVWLSGRDTYALTLGHDLVLRTPDRVRGRHPQGTIHAAHICGPINLMEGLAA